MKLEIKEPCHEDWDNMKIGMISRHCEVCEKGVMDFTEKSRAEIITYILSNPNDNVCGRMTKDQFDFRHEDIPVLIHTLKTQNTPNPFLILALVSMSLSACAQDPTPPGSIKTPPVIEKTMGEIAVTPPDSTFKDSTKDTICEVIEMGKVAPREVLQGDIALEPELQMVKGNIAYEPNPTAEPSQSRALQFAEVMPEFPGGVDAMMKYIQKKLIKPQNVVGNVYVKFIVEKDGSITNTEIVRSIPKSKNVDKAVLRLMDGMPRWIPGTNNGITERVYMTIPIRFQ